MQHAIHRTTKMIQTQHKRPSCTSQGPFFACLTVCGHHSHKFWSIYSFRQNVCVGIYILCVDGIIECCVLCVLRWSRQRFFCCFVMDMNEQIKTKCVCFAIWQSVSCLVMKMMLQFIPSLYIFCSEPKCIYDANNSKNELWLVRRNGSEDEMIIIEIDA